MDYFSVPGINCIPHYYYIAFLFPSQFGECETFVYFGNSVFFARKKRFFACKLAKNVLC